MIQIIDNRLEALIIERIVFDIKGVVACCDGRALST
jgi:hypothetical protein